MSAPESEPSGTVQIRAFRGTRRSSVYREHAFSAEAFARIVAVGALNGVSLLGTLDRHAGRELDKREARQLAVEVERLRSGGRGLDLELDRDLAAVAALARFCARASGQPWMTIERP